MLDRFSISGCCIHLQYLLFIRLTSDIQCSIVCYDCVGDAIKKPILLLKMFINSGFTPSCAIVLVFFFFFFFF